MYFCLHVSENKKIKFVYKLIIANYVKSGIKKVIRFGYWVLRSCTDVFGRSPIRLVRVGLALRSMAFPVGFLARSATVHPPMGGIPRAAINRTALSEVPWLGWRENGLLRLRSLGRPLFGGFVIGGILFFRLGLVVIWAASRASVLCLRALRLVVLFFFRFGGLGWLSRRCSIWSSAWGLAAWTS